VEPGHKLVTALPPRPSSAPRAVSAATPASSLPRARAASPQISNRKDAPSAISRQDDPTAIRPPSRSFSSITGDNIKTSYISRERLGATVRGRPGSNDDRTDRRLGQTNSTPSNYRPFNSSTYNRGDSDGGSNRFTASRLKRSQGVASKARPSDVGFFFHSQDESEVPLGFDITNIL
jgi:hypothetical protein